MGLAKRIIPCLDVDKGRVVKGVKFLDIKDAGDPVEIAARYNRAGADEITFLDITASHEGRSTLIETVRALATKVFIPLTVGGGVGSVSDVRQLLRAGADKVAINSAAVARPELVREAATSFGSQCIVVAVDAKKTSDGQWQVFTHGGRRATGIDVLQWVDSMQARGAGEFLLTSMDRDGTRQGFDVDLVRAVASRSHVPVIASGGVGDLDHLVEGVLKGYADAVLAASIFHFGQYTVKQAKDKMAAAGIEMRMDVLFE